MPVTISIDNDVLLTYVDLNFAFFNVENDIFYEDVDLKEKAECNIISSVCSNFEDRSKLSEHEYCKYYHDFYKNMKLKPKKISTPIHQSLRVFDSKSYRSIYKLIDLCMCIEYTTLLSFQVYDLEKIVGSLKYRFSDGNDIITTFHGEDKKCKKGELILVDDECVLHSVYYGNNKFKSISGKTNKSIVRIMKIPGIACSSFDNAINLFCKAINSDNYIILNKEIPVSSL